MRLAPTWTALAAVLLGGCCNGPVAYVDCTTSGISVRIVDDLGDPATAEAVTFHYKDRSLRYARCLDAEEEGQTACTSYQVPWRGPGTYTIETWAGGVVVSTEVIEASIPKDKAGQCCGDVFYDELTVEVPVQSDT